MAAAYVELGKRERAAFELFVRNLPEDRAYLVAAGLEQALSYLANLSFSEKQIAYLRGLEVMQDVSDEFFECLADFRFEGTVRAVPEGTLVFADEPLLRVEAPLVQAQVVETFLLSMVNYQTMVATKAARVVQAACSDGTERAVVDFGTRRAHGPDAGVLAARAAYIGGCIASSNVEAGFRTGIPVSGTEAHSFIMAFEDEAEAFRGYYECFGEHAILLVDTYDSLEGTRKASAVAPGMRGIRLDSGDLVGLSRSGRRILDEKGLEEASIFASGDLDEFRIAGLVERGAEIDGFGVGTKLVTSRDAPSLGGVYKLVAVEKNGRWDPRIKLSTEKATWPGPKQVYRVSEAADGAFSHDVLAAAEEPPPEHGRPLLQTVMEEGKAAAEPPDLSEIQKRAQDQLRRLPQPHRRLTDFEPYPVRVSQKLRDRFERLSEHIEEGQR